MTQYPYISNKKQSGFSLIELVIVIVIIIVLAALLLPSLQDKTRSTGRVIAQSDLVELVGIGERFFVEHSTYVGLNLSFHRSPRSPEHEKRYDISFESAPAATSFTLQAVPLVTTGNNPCDAATLTIDADGNKSAFYNGVERSDCWN